MPPESPSQTPLYEKELEGHLYVKEEYEQVSHQLDVLEQAHCDIQIFPNWVRVVENPEKVDDRFGTEELWIPREAVDLCWFP